MEHLQPIRYGAEVEFPGHAVCADSAIVDLEAAVAVAGGLEGPEPACIEVIARGKRPSFVYPPPEAFGEGSWRSSDRHKTWSAGPSLKWS